MTVARVRVRIAGRIYKLSEREGRQLLDYCRRMGVESLVARIAEADIRPVELTHDEKMGLWQAINRLWVEEEGVETLSPAVQQLRDALHVELFP